MCKDGLSKGGTWEERTNRRNGGDDFTEFQLVQDGGLSSSVQTNLFAHP